MDKYYEDAYLKERLSEAIQLQQQGKLVFASSDGNGLVNCRALGDWGYSRASGHDFELKSGAGYIDYAGRYYIFTPIEGQPLPKAAENYQRIHLAEARLDLGAAAITVQVEERLYTFTNVEIWKPLYTLLKDLNSMFAAQGTGINVWRIEAEGRPRETRFPEGVMTLSSAQASTSLLGFAADDSGALVYLSILGHKVLIASMKATLASGKYMTASARSHQYYLRGADRYECVTLPMAEYGETHAVMVNRRALPGRWEPGDTSAFLLVFAAQADARKEALRLLVERLNEALPIPVLPAWAEEIWIAAEHAGFLKSLSVSGDVSGGYEILLHRDWVKLVHDLIANQEILIPQGGGQ